MTNGASRTGEAGLFEFNLKKKREREREIFSKSKPVENGYF